MRLLSKILAVVCVIVFTSSMAIMDAHAAERQRVRVSAQPIIHGMPSWHAKETGADKKTPIAIDFMLFPSGPLQIEALGGGTWDMRARWRIHGALIYI